MWLFFSFSIFSPKQQDIFCYFSPVDGPAGMAAADDFAAWISSP